MDLCINPQTTAFVSCTQNCIILPASFIGLYYFYMGMSCCTSTSTCYTQYIYIHTCSHACIHSHTHHTLMHTSIHLSIHPSVLPPMHSCSHKHIHADAPPNAHSMQTCMHACMHAHMLHALIQTDESHVSISELCTYRSMYVYITYGHV